MSARTGTGGKRACPRSGRSGRSGALPGRGVLRDRRGGAVAERLGEQAAQLTALVLGERGEHGVAGLLEHALGAHERARPRGRDADDVATAVLLVALADREAAPLEAVEELDDHVRVDAHE